MRVKVKICGLTDEWEAQDAVRAGADILGLVFVAESARFVSWQRARAITAAARDAGDAVRIAGVFVNRTADEVVETMMYCGLDWAQLHGEEPIEWVQAGGVLHGRGYRAIRPNGDLAEQEAHRLRTDVEGMPDVLVDAFHPTARGGTGQRANWEIAARLALARRLLLAGGLNSRNVADAVEAVRPWGVDVSSGVESSPGSKDGAAMRSFVAAVRAAERGETDD